MRQDRLNIVLADGLRRALNGAHVAVPEPGRLVWQWFGDLCRTRAGGGFGPSRLTFAEIEAYARLYRWPMEPRHVDAILALDHVWMEHHAGERGAPAAHPSQPITADAFDAVFS